MRNKIIIGLFLGAVVLIAQQVNISPGQPALANPEGIVAIRGTGAPGLTCSATVNVGVVYVRTDAAAVQASLYTCSKTGSSTYAWEGPFALASGAISNRAVHITATGTVTDSDTGDAHFWNNSAGAVTYTLAVGGGNGAEHCFENAVTRSGVIKVAVQTSNTISLNGANGTTSTGFVQSGGALGDSICLRSDAANHWYAYPMQPSWSNN